MNLKMEWARLLSLLRAPGAFFEQAMQDRSDYLFRDALRMILLVLVASTALYFVFTFMNLSSLEAQVQAMKSYGPPNALPAWLQEGVAWNRILFPVFWIILIFYGGLMRHILIRLLGEPDATLARTQTVGMYASVPLILLSVPGYALGVLFPYVPGPGVPAGAAGPAALLSTALFLGGYVWHGVVAIKALKCIYKQNSGRAFLSWAWSPFAGTFLCCGLWFGGYFIAVLARGGI